MDSIYHFKKIQLQFLYCAREKDVQIISNLWLYFTYTCKQLWNCYNIYEPAVSINSPLKTNTDPQKKIQMVKIDPEQAKIFLLLVHLGTIAQFCSKKKFR